MSESELLLTIKAHPEGSVEKFQQETGLIQQKTAGIHQKKDSVRQKTLDDSTEKSKVGNDDGVSLVAFTRESVNQSEGGSCSIGTDTREYRLLVWKIEEQRTADPSWTRQGRRMGCYQVRYYETGQCNRRNVTHGSRSGRVSVVGAVG